MKKSMKKPKSPLINENGLALPLVLMLLVMFTLLGTAAYFASQNSLVQAQRLNPNLQCKYLARSAVDATIAAWSDEWKKDPSNVPTDETFYTSYNYSTDEFEDDVAANEGNDGVIKTEVDYSSSTGICTITSSVQIGSHDATVTAKSEKLIDPGVKNLTNPWIAQVEYTTLFFGLAPWKQWTIIQNPDPAYQKTKSDAYGHEYYGTYHVTDGIVNIQLPNTNDVLYANGTLLYDMRNLDYWDFLDMVTSLVQLKMPFSSSGIRYNVTGIQAKQIKFKNPLDLYWNTSIKTLAVNKVPNPHSLIVSAEYIDFEKSITIGDAHFGNLTLSLPPGSGLSGEKVYYMVADADKPKVIDHLSDKYGLVSFNAVDIKGSFGGNGKTNDPKLISNKTFFFRPIVRKSADGETNALNIGTEPNTLTDLAKWLGISNPEKDFMFKTLLEKGYLVPAPSSVTAQKEYDVLFIYE